MRVVSFVPSWTETLIEAGVSVVGRTRFCIHPTEQVKSIAVVGGTKDLKLDTISQLRPDLILLDREENTLEMAEALKGFAPIHVSHVRHVNQMPQELRVLAVALGGNSNLENYADRFENQLGRERKASQKTNALSSNQSPYCYVIWREPWMCVTRETFIASMLEASGRSLSDLWPPDQGTSSAANYPKFELKELPDRTHLLLSTEPYPFTKKLGEMQAILRSEEFKEKSLTCELIDGESYSWFGIRALRFLESL